MVIGIALALSVGAALPSQAADSPCVGLLENEGSRSNARPVQPLDLLRLRDIGSEVELPNERDFSISPDGRQIAFQLRRADPQADTYCLAMIVIALDGDRRPRIVDSGGQALKSLYPNVFGKADFSAGRFRTITPVWSSDSASVFFLKQADDTVQIWRAASDGSASRAVTNDKNGVAAFALLGDGRTLVFATRSGLAEARSSIAQEGGRGFRFDGRFSPMSAASPFPIGPLSLSYFALDLKTQATREARASERLELNRSLGPSFDNGPISAWREITNSATFPSVSRLAARLADGKSYTCNLEQCINPEENMWWSSDKRSVIYSRREGWSQDTTAFYRWTPSNGSLRRLFASQDLFPLCQPSAVGTVCTHEASTIPRRIVILDPAHGRVRAIFDPNKKFQQLELGRVNRLRWRANGVERYADLVYPVGYKPGSRYPAVVTQYISRGFLRGAVGDEYPIQAFAGRGYFVLSVQNPVHGAGLSGLKSDMDEERIGLIGFQARRSKLAAIEGAVLWLVSRGMVDPSRVGITGLSEGSSSVQFAGLHSKLFRAAAVGTCCWAPGQDAILGQLIADAYHSVGWPRLIDPAPDFWRTVSWQASAAEVAFPVLMQLADREYLSAIQSYTALRQAGIPTAMYVFPDEDHIKFHPAHRLAIYSRGLAWFDYWLKPPDHARPEDQIFATDWTSLKDAPLTAPSRLPVSDPSLGIQQPRQ